MTKRTDPYYQAQAILSRRDHSEAEMRQKLARKGFAGSEIEAVVGWLKTKKLLNDQAFVERYVTSILLGKAVGPRWVVAKLRQKRVATTLIDQVIAQEFTPERERELARAAAERWQRSHVAVADDKARLMRFLQSRGFSNAAIQAALSSTSGT